MASLDFVSIDVLAPDGRALLQGLNCRFDTREFTVVAGATGSGKSCLARLITGGLDANTGDILLDGQSIRRKAAIRRQLSALVPQSPAAHLVAGSAREEIVFGLKRQNPDHIENLLAWAQLEALASADPRNLSFGEQRRLSIITALAADTGILVLDDPFPGLDHTFIPRLIERLVQHNQTGHGVIVFTNELEKILAHADRLILLKQGRIIADALPARVLPYLDAHGFRKPAMKLGEMSWLKG